MSPPTEKLHKALARAGLGSRRELERWIAHGRVSVNGETAALGARVGPADLLRIDGRRVRVPDPRARARVLRYHKPAGQICTRRDPAGRASVFEHLPRLAEARWVAVGRLDLNTSGLLLFTDLGELAARLMHPSAGVEREYAVRVRGVAPDAALRRMLDGVELADGSARFTTIVDAGGRGHNHWFHVVIGEGRNREVRRLWESQGVTVSRLIRVRYGPVALPRRLRPGDFEPLEGAQLDGLLRCAGMP